MAAKRRRRRHRVNSHHRRTHRRRRVMHHANPPHRRTHHRRHHYRRNPPIVAEIMGAAKDGAVIVGAQLATVKVRDVIANALVGATDTTQTKQYKQVAASFLGAVVVAFVARMGLKGLSRTIAAGAMARAVTDAIAITPLSQYFGAYPRLLPRPAGAYPRAVGAWPRAAAGSAGTQTVRGMSVQGNARGSSSLMTGM
jgi:hypothetical protein